MTDRERIAELESPWALYKRELELERAAQRRREAELLADYHRKINQRFISGVIHDT